MFTVICVAALCAVAKAGIYGGSGGGGYHHQSHGHGHELAHAQQQFQHLGTFVGKHYIPPKEIRITKTVGVKIPVPYPVAVPKPYPVPVYKKEYVPKPYPVPVFKHESHGHEQAPQAFQHHQHHHEAQQAHSFTAPSGHQEQSHSFSAPSAHQEQSHSFSAPSGHQELSHQSFTAPSAHQEQTISYSAPSHNEQMSYYKESGKYTSPVFDISAFHPTVLSSKGNSYQQQGAYHQVQSFGAAAGGHAGHEQSLPEFGTQDTQSHEGQQTSLSEGYGAHQEQQQVQHQGIPDFHQYEQQSAQHFGGAQEEVKQETYQQGHEEYQQSQGHEDIHAQYAAAAQQSISSGHDEDYSHYASAASAGQEKAYAEKQQQELNAHAQEGQEEQSQHGQAQIQSHNEAPAAPAYSGHSYPAAETYSYFHLGKGGHESSASSSSSSADGHAAFGQHQQQEQQQHYQPQVHIQHQQPEEHHHQVEVIKSQNIGSFSHNLGHSVLKEVQGPQLGGHGNDLKSRPIYLPPHGHYKHY